MKNFKFIKYNDRWYVDLPEWEGSKDDLEMVSGADTLLDIIAQGDDIVHISWSEELIENYNYKLIFLREEEFIGATYMVEGAYITSFEAWLCNVTLFVFGYFPKILYIK
mgnify:CR=1 FL=1